MPGPSVPVRAAARRRRVPVPLAVCRAAAPRPFLVFDDAGNALLLKDGEPAPRGATVYVSPSDQPLLHAYLVRHVGAIARDGGIDPADRAWAIHRTLLYEITETYRGATSGTALLTRVAREAARFQAERRGEFPFFDVIYGTAYTPVTHAVDTALCAAALAANAGRDEDTLFAALLGGLFADIGKLELPMSMLLRDGPLTEAEWEQMRSHPQRSASRMRQLGLPHGAALHGAQSHHERWNGHGYPDGLRGAEIPFEARCIAIGDAYSAITVDRAFQAHRDPFEALREMSRESGAQFDPTLLRLFVALLGRSAADDAPAAGAATPDSAVA